MIEIKGGTYTGERALFNTKDAIIDGATFEDGESPLKESKNLDIKNTCFKWKYPLWYSKDVKCKNVVLDETARSGIWYTHNISFVDSIINAPKTFRRSSNISLKNTNMPNAQETMWNCDGITLENVEAKGDYLGMNSKNIVIKNFKLDGNYCFDGGENIEIYDSILLSKDSFWNTKNVKVYNSTIIGEYLGWNSKNITFINCNIESLQGMCYMDNIKMINCKLTNTNLSFEYCRNVYAEINSEIDSVKNPYSGYISAKKIGELILDSKYINPKKTKIKVEE